MQILTYVYFARVPEHAIEKRHIAQQSYVADGQKQSGGPCMRSRAPVPVDFHRQREEVIIKKNDLIDESDGFLDMRIDGP